MGGLSIIDLKCLLRDFHYVYFHHLFCRATEENFQFLITLFSNTNTSKLDFKGLANFNIRFGYICKSNSNPLEPLFGIHWSLNSVSKTASDG